MPFFGNDYFFHDSIDMAYHEWNLGKSLFGDSPVFSGCFICWWAIVFTMSVRTVEGSFDVYKENSVWCRYFYGFFHLFLLFKDVSIMIAVALYFNVSFISWSLIVAQDFAMSESHGFKRHGKSTNKFWETHSFRRIFRAWSLYTFFWLLLWGDVIHSLCYWTQFCLHRPCSFFVGADIESFVYFPLG